MTHQRQAASTEQCYQQLSNEHPQPFCWKSLGTYEQMNGS